MLEVEGAREAQAWIDSAAKFVPDAVRPVIAKAAVNVKESMREDLRDSAHFKGGAPAVTFDLINTASYSEAEIGPVSGPGRMRGDIASIAYFGGAHGGGGTVRDPQHAAAEERPAFERAMEDVLDKAFR